MSANPDWDGRMKTQALAPRAAPSLPDYSLAGETAPEHLKNAIVMLGALRRIVERTAGERPDALALVEAISARLDKALAQVEGR